MAVQTEEEQRERQACEAGMQRLPAGIQVQSASQPAGVCHVCYVEDYSDDNLLLEVRIWSETVASCAIAMPAECAGQRCDCNVEGRSCQHLTPKMSYTPKMSWNLG